MEMDHNIEKEILEQADFRAIYSVETQDFSSSDMLGEANCPFCDNDNQSLLINLGDGCFSCSSCMAAGSVFDFLMQVHNADQATVLEDLVEAIESNSEPDEPDMNNGDDGSDELEILDDEVTSGFYFDQEIYLSDAFLSLGKNSVKVLIAFLSATPDNGTGELSIPHNFLEEVYQIPRSGISKAISELREKEFLELIHHGGRGVGDRNVYRLSENYQNWTPDKKETQNKKIESEINSQTDLERGVQDSINKTLPPETGRLKSSLIRAFGSIF
jgi:hypothetical protein